MECSCPPDTIGRRYVAAAAAAGRISRSPPNLRERRWNDGPGSLRYLTSGRDSLARAGLSGKLIDDVRSLKYPQGEFTPSLISLLTGQMCKRATQGARATKGPAQTVHIVGAGTLWFSGTHQCVGDLLSDTAEIRVRVERIALQALACFRL